MLTTTPLQGVIHHLRRAVAREESGDVTDAQLLDAFVRRRDEAAFELLLWRHASMVLGVCRRQLHDHHEAEDALQATFMIFVRKAATISKRDSVGCWLHRVACRIALRARAQAARRPKSTLSSDEVPAREGPDEVLWRDLRPVLEEEVDRLPEKYRRPFILCYLEGNTNEQAAQQLGCPKGTVLSRLMRGRERLRIRLERRGVVLSGAMLACLLTSRAAVAAPSTALVSAIIKAAIPFAAGKAAAGLVSARTAAWTEGVLKAMFLTKMKITATVVLGLALLTTGAGLLTQPFPAVAQAAQREREKPRAEAPPGQRDARAASPLEARGTLKSVDADKGTITLGVTDGRQEPVEKTFTLAKNVEVGVNVGLNRRSSFREAKLADLAPGAFVALQLSEDEKTAVVILAEGPTIHGVIKGIDGEKRTLTLTTMQRGRGREEAPESEEKTFTLDKAAEIAIDDGRGRLFSVKEGRLVDLPVGALAMVKLSADLKHVLIIQAEGSTLGGTVKAVDVGKRQIQLTTRGPGRGADAGEEKTITLSPTADIVVDDGKGRHFSLKDGKLEDVPVGAIANVKLAADQQTGTVVHVQGPTASGAVKAVDANKGTITLILRAGRGDTPAEEKTYNVAKDAHVMIEGKPGKLADIKADETGPAVGLKLSLDQTTVNSIMVGGGARR
jgi:RNA polymerase sigma factor (sigma-70 family)